MAVPKFPALWDASVVPEPRETTGRVADGPQPAKIQHVHAVHYQAGRDSRVFPRPPRQATVWDMRRMRCCETTEGRFPGIMRLVVLLCDGLLTNRH